MNKTEAEYLVVNTFTHAFSEEKFTQFVGNLLPGLQPPSSRHVPNAQLPQGFRDNFHGYTRIGTYRDPHGDVLDVVVVKLMNHDSLDRARTRQRNLMAHYLNKRSKDAVLVAYITDDPTDWRFSFVKLAYKTEITERGTVKVEQEYTPARRYSFLVGENEPNHTAQKQLGDLLMQENRITIEQIEEAFNIESITKEFFEDYKALFLQIKENLDEIVSSKPEVRSEFERCNIDTANFAKKLLGQIVFLYFLQKKGWLGVAKNAAWGTGDKKFLSNLFLNKGPLNYFVDLLEPFFYEALAIEREDDYYPDLYCKVPFLNGGLFEPLNGYDWKNIGIYLDNKVFEDIFKVFNLYNFTVQEDEPLEKEVAVDPEMLGRVFESLIEENIRKGLGAYYTPRSIVHFMCQESLINFLNSELNLKERGLISDHSAQIKLFDDEQSYQTVLKGTVDEVIIPLSDIQAFIREGDFSIEVDSLKETGDLITKDYGLPESIRNYANLIDRALEEIKICDLAIGSGAFPVGMMTEIVRARKVLTPYIDDSKVRNDYELKWNCIEKSLYGVDIDAGAVEIAKLRLWLSLVVDEQHFGTIRPLPNLDYKIICGNSLLFYPYQRRELSLYEELKEQFFKETHPEQKKKLKVQIDQVLHDLFKNTHKSLGYQVTVDFKINFSEVFKDNGGFDVVIGNPPYIKEYTNRHAFDGLRQSPYYQGKMDLWYFFGSVGLDILRPNGTECFIAPNNWVSNAGASKFRKKVLQDAVIIKFIDFGDYKVFEAGIQTMVYVLQRNNIPSSYDIDYRRLNYPEISQDILARFLYSNFPSNAYEIYTVGFEKREYINKFITFQKPYIKGVLNKIQRASNLFLIENEVAQGIVSPQDLVNKKSAQILKKKFKVGEGIFVLSDKEKQSLNLLPNEELDIVRPYYSTEELDRYFCDPQNRNWILYTRSNINAKINKYPNVKKHLDQFIGVITSDNRPYGLHRAREEKFFKGEKIISLRKCLQPTFTYTNFDCYVSQTFFIIKTTKVDMKYLTGLLNSKVVAFWLRHNGKMQGSHYQVDKEPLLSIPLINTSNQNINIVKKLVDYILTLKSMSQEIGSEPSGKMMIRYFEQIIDALVYELYFEEEFHHENRNFFQLLTLEKLPDVNPSNAGNIQFIKQIYTFLFDKNHPIRQGIYYLDSNETVRVIEGKYENPRN